MNQSNNRNLFWDIVKCLGIICIILGHSCGNTKVIAFVYLFHIPLFFFVSGYLFNPEKWKGRLPEFIGSRIASVWPRYVIYGLLFVLLHNAFVNAGALNDVLYNHTAMLQNFLNYAMLVTGDSLSGALWFIPVWLIAMFIFALIVEISRGKYKELITGVLSLGCAVLGLTLYKREAGIYYHAQTSFIAVGFMYMGYALKRFAGDGFKSALKWYYIPVCAAALIFVNQKLRIFVDLSTYSCGDGMVYLTGAIGIWMVMCIAKYIEKAGFVSKVMAFIGSHSFDIMALHFMVIKLVDIAVNRIYPKYPEYLINFPAGYAWIAWPAYLILGLAIPTLIGYGVDLLLGKVKRITKDKT